MASSDAKPASDASPVIMPVLMDGGRDAVAADGGGTPSGTGTDGGGGDTGVVGPPANGDGADAGMVGEPASGRAIGCSDGTREGFLDLNRYPGLTACAGGWSTPGLNTQEARTPRCNRQAGNSGGLTSVAGCSPADLCAAGWHVCRNADEVASHSNSCDAALAPGSPKTFFATAQPSSATRCEATGENNIIGCGNFGWPAYENCGPLNARLSSSVCDANAPWRCQSGPSLTDELAVVTKTGTDLGGVLCCRD